MKRTNSATSQASYPGSVIGPTRTNDNVRKHEFADMQKHLLQEQNSRDENGQNQLDPVRKPYSWFQIFLRNFTIPRIVFIVIFVGCYIAVVVDENATETKNEEWLREERAKISSKAKDVMVPEATTSVEQTLQAGTENSLENQAVALADETEPTGEGGVDDKENETSGTDDEPADASDDKSKEQTDSKSDKKSSSKDEPLEPPFQPVLNQSQYIVLSGIALMIVLMIEGMRPEMVLCGICLLFRFLELCDNKSLYVGFASRTMALYTALFVLSAIFKETQV